MYKLFTILLIGVCLSCGDGFLDVKPNSDIVVPQTLDDFQQILDAGLIRNAPELLDLQADDYYIEQKYLSSMRNFVFKNAYVWADDIYETKESEIDGWDRLYEQIFYANVVLDGLAKIEVSSLNREYYEHIQGSALFIRAMALHYLLQLYSPAYHPERAATDLGVALPLISDVNQKLVRESVTTCYDQIISDLKESVKLLGTDVDFSRPTKAAAEALLARVYLLMGDYEQALQAADLSLDLHNDLTDLNLVKTRDYKRTIYMTLLTPATLVGSNSQNTIIDADLYQSYADNDLRKTTFYKIGNKGLPIKNSFHALSIYCFSGLDTDEQYLIKAECLARLSRTGEAMKILNVLLGSLHANFVALEAATKEEALTIILQERRKQLVFRGLRWSDLKRYNRDGAQITLTRKLDDATYTLEPNSNKWMLPIPTNEIRTSSISQNPR